MKNCLFVGVGLAALASVGRSQYSEFDPNAVPVETKEYWCKDQRDSCTTLCGGEQHYELNSCDHVLLTYACTCDDGTEPELEKYTGTMPTHKCEWVKGDDCGTLDPATANQEDTVSGDGTTTTSSAPSTATSTGTSSPSQTSSTSTAQTTAPSNDSSSDSNPETSGLSIGGQVALGVAAAVMLIVLIAFLFFRLGRRRSASAGREKLGSDDEREFSGRFEKPLHDASSSQMFEMSATRPPVELDSRPSTAVSPQSKAPPPEPIELDSRMVPLDIRIERAESDNTKYRFN